MSAVDTPAAGPQVSDALRVDHIVQGRLLAGGAVRYRSRDLGVDFATPEIDLDALVTTRLELPPLADTPLEEIIAFLVRCGERLNLSENRYMQEACDNIVATNPLPRRVIENLFSSSQEFFSETWMRALLAVNFSNPAALDDWVERVDPRGARGSVRAFPPRMIHMLAGNSPGSAVSSIAYGALVKAINVFKMPSSDPFTATAVLRTMAEVDPDHPVVRSMSAVYWKGGDERVERALYRPQYFDRIVAWGGGPAIDNVIKYLGPGLQLISFDPKSSISMIGPEGFADEVLDAVADATAEDVTLFNQEACFASRFVFVEGDREGIEAFCARLAEALAVDRFTASEQAHPLPVEERDQVMTLEVMGDALVWGRPDGRGMVILTEEPLEFHPSNKTANVVHVPSLEEAIRYVNVATQTIGVYPRERRKALRDRLASAGAQRVVELGNAGKPLMGAPHDAMYPLQRFVHWMSDEDG